MTKIINLKADLNTITENKIWGYDVTKEIPGPLGLDFIWNKQNGNIPEKIVTDREILITHETSDLIYGVGNGKPSEDLLILLNKNGSVTLSRSSRTQTTKYIPRYNYGYIHEQFTCPECGKTYSTDDIISDYDDEGYKYYVCPECDEILDIKLVFEEISDDKKFDFEITKV